MNKENYYTIYGWMVSDLKLNIYELNVFAFLYGFKDGFEGSIQYIADSTCMHRNKAYRTLNSLIEKGYLKKEGKERTRCKYTVTRQVTACYTVDNRTVTQRVHNNNKHINTNNKYTNQSSFNSFEQRVYNFSELEKMIRSN